MRVSAIDMVTPTGLAQSGRFNGLVLANRQKTATELRGGPYQKANGICAPASDWRHKRGLTTDERVRFDMADTEYSNPIPRIQPFGDARTLHGRLIAGIVQRYPAATSMRFLKRIMAATGEDAEEFCALTFRPDAFVIDHASQTVTMFEVEVTHPVHAEKLEAMSALWFDLDAIEWDLRLIAVDRHGFTRAMDLQAEYYASLPHPSAPVFGE